MTAIVSIVAQNGIYVINGNLPNNLHNINKEQMFHMCLRKLDFLFSFFRRRLDYITRFLERGWCFGLAFSATALIFSDPFFIIFISKFHCFSASVTALLSSSSQYTTCVPAKSRIYSYIVWVLDRLLWGF